MEGNNEETTEGRKKRRKASDNIFEVFPVPIWKRHKICPPKEVKRRKCAFDINSCHNAKFAGDAII